MAIAVIGAAMLVEFSPASPRQNLPATKQAFSGLPGAANRPARSAASPARQLAANYGKLPLSFEANEGQTDGRVEVTVERETVSMVRGTTEGAEGTARGETGPEAARPGLLPSAESRGKTTHGGQGRVSPELPRLGMRAAESANGNPYWQTLMARQNQTLLTMSKRRDGIQDEEAEALR